MGKLANISGKEAVKAFQKAGWQPVGQVGSHLVLIKPGARLISSSLSTKNSPLEHSVPSFVQRA